jgi:hypothetical protein
VFGKNSHSRAVDTFRRVSILGKGSANLNIWSTSNSSWLLIRSGVQRNATLSFERSNRLVHRADLILHSSPNESVATARAIHAATVHILRWTVDSMASLALLGFSSRRPQLSGSLLMPATTTEPRRLMSINDEGKVGTTVLGGSAHVGWAADSSIFASLLGSPQRRSRFASIAAHHLDVYPNDVTLRPVQAEACGNMGLQAFCQTGPSAATPLGGGSVVADVLLRQAYLSIPGGACWTNRSVPLWTFGPLTNDSTTRMECGEAAFRVPADAQETLQLAAAAQMALPRLAEMEFERSSKMTASSVTELLRNVHDDSRATLVVHSADSSGRVSIVSGFANSATVFVGGRMWVRA